MAYGNSRYHLPVGGLPPLRPATPPPPQVTLAPAPQPTAPMTPPEPPSKSPIHDAATAILIQNPATTAGDIATFLGIPQPLAQSVYNDVQGGFAKGYPSGGAAPPQVPPQNPVTQAFVPPSTTNRPPLPAAIAQGSAMVPPMPPPQSATPGTAAQPPEMIPPKPMVPQDFGAPIPGYTRPQSLASPPPSDIPPADAAAARAAMLAKMGVLPGAYAPPGQAVGAAQLTPLAESAPRHDRFMEGLKKFLPAALVAGLTYKNPAVGGAILGGMQQGQQQLDAEAIRQANAARVQKQQDIDNALKIREQASTEAYQKGQLANTAAKNDTTAQHYKDMAARYGDQAMADFGKEIAKYSSNPEAQFGIAQRYDKAHGTTGFTDSLGSGLGETDRKAYDDLRAKAAQDRVNAYSQQVQANVGDIASRASLRKSQAGYLDAKTGQVVPDSEAQIRLRNATADYLTEKTGQVVPLADAEIAWKDEQTQALPYVVGAKITTANSAAANANTNANKGGANGSITDAVRNQIYHNYLAPRKGPFGVILPAPVVLDQDGNLMANPNYSIDDKGQIDPQKAMEANDALNEAVQQNNGRHYGRDEQQQGASVPPAVAPVQPVALQGRQTPRSVARKNWYTASGIPDFDATQFIGQSVNKDGQPACVDGVCYLASKAGVPVPQTRNAAEFEKDLPNKGWVKVPRSQNPKPNDIIIGRGTGPSGRHVEWYVGDGYTVAADVKAGGYSNKLTKTPNVYGPDTTTWRYAGSGAPPSGGLPAAQASSGVDVILTTKMDDKSVTFHAPRNKSEFYALPSAQRLAYIAYIKSQKAQ